jgi:NTP pyrophosphatase (non-canonical NTP hydrolase)
VEKSFETTSNAYSRFVNGHRARKKMHEKRSDQSFLTVKDLQTAVDRWIKAYGVRYFSEMTNLAVLMEEVGELARLIARTYGEQSHKDDRASSDVGDEIADVLFVLVCIANQTGVDLETAISKNLEKKTARDSRRHLRNPKLTD